MYIDWRVPPSLIRPLAIGAFGLCLAAGALWWFSKPVTETSLPTPRLIAVPTIDSGYLVVDVIGAVHRPGVFRLPAGSRVVDAVTAAGGLLAGRSPVVNMARPVVDGEQIVIGDNPAIAAASTGTTNSGLLDINAADAAALDGLPGIGPVLAERIVAYRSDHGRFAHTRDLLEVPGIGDAKFANLSSSVTVG